MASEAFHYHFYNRVEISCRRFATDQWPDGIGKKISKDLPLKVSASVTSLDPTGYCYTGEEHLNRRSVKKNDTLNIKDWCFLLLMPYHHCEECEYPPAQLRIVT